MSQMLDALGLSELRHLKPRQLLAQILNFALILSTAFMLWKGLSVATNSPSPIVVVLSGSMEPAFQRGDLLFLWNRNLGFDKATSSGTQVGEIGIILSLASSSSEGVDLLTEFRGV